MALTWALSDIETLVRALTGKKSTEQLSQSVLQDKINDYYRNVFPLECEPEKLKDWLTQITSVDDSGEYSVSSDVLKLEEPCTLNGAPITLYQDVGKFFAKYPKDTGSPYCMGDPGLAIGTTKPNVATAAFSYRISDHSYSKVAVAAGTALSGDTVPQNKYGAWRLEINTSGTISIVEADGNGDGYATPALAVAGLANESSSNACMGFVTAICTGSAGFVPGTTDLDGSDVTATYTDHFHTSRKIPATALLSGETLYLRPKADDIFQFKARTVEKPTALSGDTAILLPEWGRLIAYGTAILIMSEEKDTDGLSAHTPVYDHLLTLIGRKDIKQKNVNMRAKPRW